jgi:hypothetical protein
LLLVEAEEEEDLVAVVVLEDFYLVHLFPLHLVSLLQFKLVPVVLWVLLAVQLEDPVVAMVQILEFIHHLHSPQFGV